MTCRTCLDVGIVALNFQEGDEYGICLCAAGEQMRRSMNNGRLVPPLWRAWAALNKIDPAIIHPIEDVLTPAELAERGFTELNAPANALGAIAAAARGRGSRLR